MRPDQRGGAGAGLGGHAGQNPSAGVVPMARPSAARIISMRSA
jgi:hypothetical protein